MNAKYYARRLEWLKRINLGADILVALTTSSAFAGLAIWKNDIGIKFLGILIGISVLISTLRPVLRIADKIDGYSKVHYGYLEVYYRIEALISDMRSQGRVTNEHRIKASDLSERFRALEL